MRLIPFLISLAASAAIVDHSFTYEHDKFEYYVVHLKHTDDAASFAKSGLELIGQIQEMDEHFLYKRPIDLSPQELPKMKVLSMTKLTPKNLKKRVEL
jgi:hypothetical protein